IKAVDVMGGVNIYLNSAEAAALGMNPGNNLASSSQALAYARLRKIDSDFYRMGRQRQVLNAVLNQLSASSAATIYNVATVILPSVVTNVNVMPYINNAHSYLSYGRKQMQIPRTSDMWMFYNRYGQEVGGFDHTSTARTLINFLTN
ncbi:MAG: LCP family protein, partial [Eubacteriales bacterium]|nr:LCP family protein [Eubacteriales bacterium]